MVFIYIYINQLTGTQGGGDHLCNTTMRLYQDIRSNAQIIIWLFPHNISYQPVKQLQYQLEFEG